METNIQNQFSSKDFLKLLPEALISLTRKKQELSLAIYKGLEKGKAVSIDDLKSTTTLSRDVINDFLSEWPGIFYDDAKRIIGYWGLAIQEMLHKIELKDKTLYGWCAWDTLFIPQLIDKDAIIRSIDNTTKEEIVIEIDRQGNLISGNDDIVVSMLTVDEEKFKENVVTSFCHFIYFFKNKTSGEVWVSKHDGTFLITLKEAIELSQTKNRLQYKDFIH